MTHIITHIIGTIYFFINQLWHPARLEDFDIEGKSDLIPVPVYSATVDICDSSSNIHEAGTTSVGEHRTSSVATHFVTAGLYPI